MKINLHEKLVSIINFKFRNLKMTTGAIPSNLARALFLCANDFDIFFVFVFENEIEIGCRKNRGE